MERSKLLLPSLLLAATLSACVDQSVVSDVTGPDVPDPSFDRGGMPALRLQQPGPYAVGYRFEDAVLPDARPLRLHFWYPAAPTAGPLAVYRPRLYGVPIEPGVIDPMLFEAESDAAVADAPVASGGPFPAIVISSGYGAMGHPQAAYAEHLASHGFVVVSMDHNGSSLEDMAIDILSGAVGHQVLDCFDGQPAPCTDDGSIIDPYPGRFEDVGFVFDVLDGNASGSVGSFLAGSVRTGGYGMMGHSSGASDAIAMAGGSPEYPDLEPDPRIKAIMPMGAPYDQYMPELSVPILLVVGSEDHMTPTPWAREIFDAISSNPRMMVELQGAVHHSYNTTWCKLLQSAGALVLASDAAVTEQLLMGAMLTQDAMGHSTDYCSYEDFTTPVDIRGLVEMFTGFEVTPTSVPALLGLEETTRIIDGLATAFFKANLAGEAQYDRFLQPQWVTAPATLTRCFDDPAGTFCWESGTNGYVKR